MLCGARQCDAAHLEQGTSPRRGWWVEAAATRRKVAAQRCTGARSTAYPAADACRRDTAAEACQRRPQSHRAGWCCPVASASVGREAAARRLSAAAASRKFPAGLRVRRRDGAPGQRPCRPPPPPASWAPPRAAPASGTRAAAAAASSPRSAATAATQVCPDNSLWSARQNNHAAHAGTDAVTIHAPCSSHRSYSQTFRCRLHIRRA